MRSLQQLWKRPRQIVWLLCLVLLLPISFSLLPQLRSASSNFSSPTGGVNEQILVDQFGWRSQSPKVALFANPLKGQNKSRRYRPGKTFELRRASNDAKVYQGELVVWKRGKTDDSSGDQVWSADFSSIEIPGEYYVYDPKNQQRSHHFVIQDNPYAKVLSAATKTFYYQRCGTEITAKHGGNWSHPPCHIGREQDLQAARYITGKAARDVHGGWHDAGDFNKYLPFTAKTLWHLFDAYEQNPQAFDDQQNIPESGNGVPDLLDEVKWELDWMLRMQLGDGSVANRVASGGEGDPLPHEDQARRYYTEPTTWATSAFITGAANGARLFAPFEATYPGYSDRLLAAAEQAWTFLASHPNPWPSNGTDHGSKPALSPASQANEEGTDAMLRLWAAAELYRTTGNATYGQAFEAMAGFPKSAATANSINLSSETFDPYQHLAFITYARTAQPSPHRQAILQQLKQSLQSKLATVNNLDNQGIDPYRAYIDIYHWGSNQSKANWGLMFILAQELGLTDLDADSYRNNGEEYLHYFHGRNPLGWVYLSNMGKKGADAGAEKSVMHLYHGWFPPQSPYDGADSTYGPAPGFVTGGPNQYYSAKQVSPPYGEPVQKAFKDWNLDKEGLGIQSQAPWEITEPAIYYQAAYVNLLSYFAKAAS